MCFDCCDREGNCPQFKGVKITDEILQKYSPELREAWETFVCGFQILESLNEHGGLIDRKSIPDKVAEAMCLILSTRIPGYKYKTGKSSCFMRCAQSKMTAE